MPILNPDFRKKRITVTRAHAVELLRGLIERARAVNDGAEFSYVVTRIAVFGSYLSDKDPIGDLDVAVRIKPRYSDRDQQHEANQRRLKARKTRAVNLSDYFGWPEIEVWRFLKARSTAMSLHEMEELDTMRKLIPGTKTKVVFKA